MAVRDLFGNVKEKMRSLYNNFFYDGQEAPAPRMQEEAYRAPQEPYGQQPQAPYQNPYAQSYAYPQPSYGQPQPQPQYQQAGGFAGQVYQPQQPRNRRSGRQENNVVDFGAYQQQYQPVYQQQEPQPQAAPQQSAEAPAAQPQGTAPASARVINARGMGDCRSAITLLRNGDAVLIVLENVADPAEMRRLVDTLSGACYSLMATITKVSRYGVYLLAPQALAVYTDQTTNQMNGAPGRVPARNYQPNYNAQQRPAYQAAPQPQPQPQPTPQAAVYQQPQQGFTQRTATPDEAAQTFYARTAPQAAQVPPFSAQPAGYGYAPDVSEAVDQ